MEDPIPPSIEELEDEYIQFIEEHPRFPRRFLKAKFPDLEQMESSRRVAEIFAEKERLAREEARKESLDDAYELEQWKHEWKSMQDKGFTVLNQALDGHPVTKEQLDAAKFVLSGKQSHAKRSGELQADKESQSNSTDIPYPKPSGPAKALG